MSSSSPSSASAIVAEAVSGSHDLEIKGYSLTKGLGKGQFLRSDIFVIAGHRWYIKYYPDSDGRVSDDADYISIYVKRDDNVDGKDVTAKFEISLLDHDGKSEAFSNVGDRFDIYGPKGAWGFSRFMKREDLEESTHLLKDDSFSIRCHLTVRKETRTVKRGSFITVPPSKLHLHLLNLLRSAKGCDVSFEVGGETFPAHRYIVAARSSVFRAELLGPMKEKEATCVWIVGMEAKVFKGMLHFIYTDSLPEIDEDEIVEMAQHLLVAADRYNLERLKLLCEQTLCEYISKETAATTLVLAEQHVCAGLKQECFRFLASLDNLKAVMASDGFEHLRSSCPSMLEALVINLAP